MTLKVRVALARVLIRAGWKLLGVHVSPGTITIPGIGDVKL